MDREQTRYEAGDREDEINAVARKVPEIVFNVVGWSAIIAAVEVAARHEHSTLLSALEGGLVMALFVYIVAWSLRPGELVVRRMQASNRVAFVVALGASMVAGAAIVIFARFVSQTIIDGLISAAGAH